MTKAISYMRFSAIHQGKGSTLDRQQELIDQWFSNNPDVERSNLSVKDEGKSGFKGTHLKHGLGLILKAIEQRKIKGGDFILVEAIDRIGRLEPLQMTSLIQRIVEAGVVIVTLEDQTHYTKQKLNDGSGALFVLIGKIQQAHEYSKRLSTRITAAYEKKRRKARKGEPIKIVTPVWLTSDGDLIPDKAAMVKDCIDLYLRGHGTRRIILDLVEKHPTLRTVHPTTLKRWFSNRALFGEWENGGDHIPDVFEPLIDSNTFYQLKKDISRRTKTMSPEETYDLSGLVECSGCGSRYHFRRKEYKGRTIVYANCSTYLKRGKTFCENNKTWPYEILMEIFESSYAVTLYRAARGKHNSKENERLDTLKEQRSEINNQIDTLVDLLVQIPGQQNIIDKIADAEERKKGIEKDVKGIEKSIFSLETDDQIYDSNIGDSLNDWFQELESDPIYKRSVLKKAGYRIRGYKEEMEVSESEDNEMTTYTLVKRSTKHNCYFVEKNTPSMAGLDNVSMQIAIGRNGVINAGVVDNWDHLFPEKEPTLEPTT